MKSTILVAGNLGLASCRIGMGPCPTTFPKVNDAFSLNNNLLSNGRFHLTYGDALGVWADGMFLPSDHLQCFAANVTKTSTGFTWSPYVILPSLSECRLNVKCDPGADTCNCYVTTAPWQTVYVDSNTQTVAAYQCSSLRDFLNLANKNLGYPFYITNLIYLFGSALDSLHFTAIVVGTKQPWTTNAALSTFINNFPDQQPGYVPNGFAQWVGSLFGYNYRSTYSMSDLATIDQSNKTCQWPLKP